MSPILLFAIPSSGLSPGRTGSVWPAASFFSLCWQWSRAPACLRKGRAASRQPAWRAAIMTENAPLRRNVAPTAVATPARLPKTLTRVSKLHMLIRLYVPFWRTQNRCKSSSSRTAEDRSPVHLRRHTIRPHAHTHTWGPSRVSDQSDQCAFWIVSVPQENHRENLQMQNILKNSVN